MNKHVFSEHFKNICNTKDLFYPSFEGDPDTQLSIAPSLHIYARYHLRNRIWIWCIRFDQSAWPLQRGLYIQAASTPLIRRHYLFTMNKQNAPILAYTTDRFGILFRTLVEMTIREMYRENEIARCIIRARIYVQRVIRMRVRSPRGSIRTEWCQFEQKPAVEI